MGTSLDDGRKTYRDQLWDLATGQYGYVTTSDATELGVPSVALRRLAARGSLRRISRGLYRFTDFPVSELDGYMEAVLWVGPDAVLSHDAVLALHDLAFANPSTIRVTTPHRVRKTRQRRDISIVQAEIPPNEGTRYAGIPSTTVARALLDSRPLIMRGRLVEAADEARQRGLLLSDEYHEVTHGLRVEL